VGRSMLPLWSDELADARTACRVDPTTPKIIEVAPGGWQMQMTCGELDARDR